MKKTIDRSNRFSNARYEWDMKKDMVVTIRPWGKKDLHSLIENANEIAVAKFMTDGFPHPYTEDDGVRFIEYAASQVPVRIFTIDINGKAVGGIGIHPQKDIYKKNAELGYWLGTKFWKQGIITQSVKYIVRYTFETFDIDRIFARPFATNFASRRVLEKAGFSLEGRFQGTIIKYGQLHDELIYSIRRR